MFSLALFGHHLSFAVLLWRLSWSLRSFLVNRNPRQSAFRSVCTDFFRDPLPITQLLKGIWSFSSIYKQTPLVLSLYPQILVRSPGTQNPAPLNLWGIVPGPELMNWNDLEGDFAQSISPPCRKVNSLLWVILLVFAHLFACSTATVFNRLVLHRQSTFYFVLILCLFPLWLALCTVKKKKKAFGIRMESL